VDVACSNLVLVRIWKKLTMIKGEIPTYLKENFLTQIIKELKISVEQGTA
jgi:hypothetical protein